jgi:hypothetical protein
MKATQTELQMFIETAAGFWRAIGELDQVAANVIGSDDLQREAHSAGQKLQKTLDTAIRDWNGMLDSEHPPVSLCRSQSHYVPWQTDACEIYIAGPGTGGYCEACWTRRIEDQAREAARG